MTVVSIGIDLEHIERFARMGRAAWSAFYERVFTPAEQTEFGNSALSLALCFSAKEAVSKVLGTGLHINQSDEVCCKDIEINCDCGLQRPRVKLSGKALKVAGHLKISEIVLDWQHNHCLVYSIACGADSPAEINHLRIALKQSLSSVADSLGSTKRFGLKQRRKAV